MSRFVRAAAPPPDAQVSGTRISEHELYGWPRFEFFDTPVIWVKTRRHWHVCIAGGELDVLFRQHMSGWLGHVTSTCAFEARVTADTHIEAMARLERETLAAAWTKPRLRLLLGRQFDVVPIVGES